MPQPRLPKDWENTHGVGIKHAPVPKAIKTRTESPPAPGRGAAAAKHKKKKAAAKK